jgi:deoxyribodipyrimidine photo-lyase
MRIAAAAAAVAAAGPSTPRPLRAAVIWMRSDLRVSDHAGVHHATLDGAPGLDWLLPFHALIEPEELVPSDFNQDDSEAEAGGIYPTCLGLPPLGPHQLRARLQALSALRGTLRALGSDLLVARSGAVEAAIAAVGAACDAGVQMGAPPLSLELHYYMSPGRQAGALERRVEEAAAAAAAARGAGFQARRHWGHTLYHPDDLPYEAFLSSSASSTVPLTSGNNLPTSVAVEAGGTRQTQEDFGAKVAFTRLASIPDVMSDFRRATQATAPVQRPLPTPRWLPKLPPGAAGSGPFLSASDPLPAGVLEVYEAAGPLALQGLQRLQNLTGLDAATLDAIHDPADPRSAVPFAISEAEGRRRLRRFLQELCLPQAPLHYRESRMSAVGVDSSAKLSPFLALGCLSPRQVYYAADMALRGLPLTMMMDGEEEDDDGIEELVAWEEPSVESPGPRWLQVHLAIRDFFVFSGMKHEEGESRRHRVITPVFLRFFVPFCSAPF